MWTCRVKLLLVIFCKDTVTARLITRPAVEEDDPSRPSWCSDCLNCRGPVAARTFDICGGCYAAMPRTQQKQLAAVAGVSELHFLSHAGGEAPIPSGRGMLITLMALVITNCITMYVAGLIEARITPAGE